MTDLRDVLANARAALDEVDAALGGQKEPAGMDQLIRGRLGIEPDRPPAPTNPGTTQGGEQ